MRNFLLNLFLFSILSLLFQVHFSIAGHESDRFVQGDPGNKITFGLEIEVSLEKHPKINEILTFYKPNHYPEFTPEEKATLGFPDSAKAGDVISSPDWNALKPEQRKAFAIFANQEKFAKKIEFVKIPYAERSHTITTLPESTFSKTLPMELLREGTGNLEFRGFVFQNIQESREFMHQFEERFQEGDVQGHVVFQAKNARNTPQARLIDLSHAPGYMIYAHDHAMLERLEEEQERFKKDGRTLPGIHLISQSLPFISTQHVQETRDAVMSIGNETADVRVTRVAAAALRTQSYPRGHVGFELRQFDLPAETPKGTSLRGTFGKLIQAMDELSANVARDGSLKAYEKYTNLVLPEKFTRNGLGAEELKSFFMNEIMTEDDFKQNQAEMEKNYVAQLEKLQQRLDPSQQGLSPEKSSRIAKNIFAFEASCKTGKCFGLSQFLFPLREWESYPALENLSPEAKKQMQEKIKKHSVEYLTLLKAQFDFEPDAKGDMTDEKRTQIVTELRKGIGAWAGEVQLSKAFAKPPEAKAVPAAIEPVTPSHSQHPTNVLPVQAPLHHQAPHQHSLIHSGVKPTEKKPL